MVDVAEWTKQDTQAIALEDLLERLLRQEPMNLPEILRVERLLSELPDTETE